MSGQSRALYTGRGRPNRRLEPGERVHLRLAPSLGVRGSRIEILHRKWDQWDDRAHQEARK